MASSGDSVGDTSNGGKMVNDCDNMPAADTSVSPRPPLNGLQHGEVGSNSSSGQAVYRRNNSNGNEDHKSKILTSLSVVHCYRTFSCSIF